MKGGKKKPRAAARPKKARRTDSSHYRQLFDSMRSGVAVYRAVDGGRDFVFADFNAAGERIEGVSRESVIGRRVTEAFPGIADFGLLQIFRRVWKTGKPARHPITLYKDERTRSWRENYVYKLPSGEVVAVYDDVTESRSTEAQLARSEERYRTLFEQSTDGILLHTDKGQIFDANPQAGVVFGYPRKELIGMNVRDLHTKSSLPESEAAFGRIARRGEVRFESRFRGKDGSERDLEINARFLNVGTGIILSLIRDNTERRKSEQALMTLQKIESLGVLAGGIAHDFNNILTGILGNLSSARAEAEGESLRSLLRESEDACLAAKGLSRQLLTFAQGGKPVVKTMWIGTLLQEVAVFAARGSSSKCVFSIDTDLRPAKADRDQLSQVIHNLVINAHQAMPGGGRIRIGASNVVVGKEGSLPLEAGRYVRITVKDKGCGMPESLLAKVFDPYFSTKESGRGLGLATCHSIVSRHGGHIGVESEPGRGTVFTLHLPAASRKDIPPETEPAEVKTGSGRVLIMDDDGMVVETLARIVRGLGYTVRSASDGARALKACEKAAKAGKPFDVVIMDLTVPGGMGGQEAARRLKKTAPKTKAVVSSGYSTDPIMSEWAEHGFAGVLAKPYRIEEVSELLSQVLAPAPRRRR